LGQNWLVDLILYPFLGFKRIRLAESDVELVEHVEAASQHQAWSAHPNILDDSLTAWRYLCAW